MTEARRSRIADEAHTARAQFNALLDATVDAIVLIDDKGLIQAFNRSAETLLGYSAEEVLGRNVSMLMPEPYRSEHDDYLDRYLSTGEARIIGIGREVTAQRKDGTCFPIDLSVGEIADDVGPARFVGVIRDLTDRKAAEHEMMEQRERLAHLTRLGTIGEMTTAIAHEVNQPLTAISTYAQACERLLRNNLGDADEVLQTLNKIGAQARRAGEVIRHLRRLVKQQENETDVADINALIRDLLQLAQVDARAQGLVIETELAADLPAVEVDGIQIQQVILNLLRNAVDAMAGSRRDDRILLRSTATEGDWIEVQVLDSGPGMPDDVKARLFQPFVTTKADGLGVGVAICRSIVEGHGGELSFEDNHPTGTIARFVLPPLPGGKAKES